MNDRCSSNSSLGAGAPAGPPVFSADFGLGNNVAWPAQVANTLGVTDFANYAVTGSEPRQWMNLAPEPDQPDNGQFHDILVRLENDDPDLVLATLGANPLLADFLTGPGMACALFDDEATQRALFEDCIGAVVQENLVSQRLIAVYLDILAHTAKAKILVSHYYLTIPAITLFTEWQAQAMVDAVNGQVDTAVAAVKESGANFAERIAISDPTRFDSGWPGTGQDATCGAKIPGRRPEPPGVVRPGRADRTSRLRGVLRGGPALDHRRRHRHPPQPRRPSAAGHGGVGADPGQRLGDPVGLTRHRSQIVDRVC